MINSLNNSDYYDQIDAEKRNDLDGIKSILLNLNFNDKIFTFNKKLDNLITYILCLKWISHIVASLRNTLTKEDPPAI